MQGTIFKDHWVDHQLLFHLLLIPFTWIGNLYRAAQAAAIFWAAAAFYAVYEIIRRMGEPGSAWRRYAFLWPLLLAASSDSLLYRLTQTRVQAISLLFLMSAYGLMEKGRYRLLFFLGFFYSWLYNGSVILLPLAALFGLSAFLTERRPVWKPLAWSAAGVASGFILNPYFPQSILFLIRHVTLLIRPEATVPLSAEWVNFSSWYLFQTTQGAWLCLFLGILLLAFSRQTLSRQALFWLLANTFMLVLFFKARRFVEYWPVFAVVFFARCLYDTQTEWLPLFQRPESGERRGFDPRLVRGAAAGLIFVLFLSAGFRAVQTARAMGQDAPPQRFAAAAEWLKAHTPKGSVVFNEPWDIFPDLFFHNHHNRWVAGLNPAFTYMLDPRLWDLYRRISQGNLPDTARYLRRDFGAAYALTLKKGGGLIRLAEGKDNGLILMWEDRETVIYKVEASHQAIRIDGAFHPYQIVSGKDHLSCVRKEAPSCPRGPFPVSGDALECKTREKTAGLVWQTEIPQSGKWRYEGRFPPSSSRGTARLFLNDEPVGTVADFSGEGKKKGLDRFTGETTLSEGPLKIKILYSFPENGDFHPFGLEFLRFTKVKES